MVVQGEEVAVAVQGPGKDGSAEKWLGGLGVAVLPSLSLVAKYSCLLCWTPREKSSVEEEIKEKEEAIRERTSEVQVRCRCLCLAVRLCLFPQSSGHADKMCSSEQMFNIMTVLLGFYNQYL